MIVYYYNTIIYKKKIVYYKIIKTKFKILIKNKNKIMKIKLNY